MEFKSAILKLFSLSHGSGCTDKEENKISLIYREIQMGSGATAKSYMRKGFLIDEEMLKYFHHL